MSRRTATTKRKIAEAQINPNSLSGYYVGNEIDPGGWDRVKLAKDDWTHDSRIIPRYQSIPKKAWRLERMGTYNTLNFISLRSGDFYPGELLIIDFPPVINELPITKRTHVKANRIWDIKHRRIQDDRSMGTYIEYNSFIEANVAAIEENIKNNIKKRSDTATRDYMVIYAPHDKLIEIMKYLMFDPDFITANTLPSGALTIFCTFEMYLALIAKHHPFAVFYYHWKMTECNDPKISLSRNIAGNLRIGPNRVNTENTKTDSQGHWVVIEYKRTDSEWNQYGIPVDRYDKALGQITVGMINETGNMSQHFENCLWETTVLYTVETIKAEVLEKEYLPEYMPFNGLERMDQDDGIVLPRNNQTFPPTHGMTPKVTIMSNRGENKFINTRFLLTDVVDGQGRPNPPQRTGDTSFYPNWNNTTDMITMGVANPFSNICGNKEAIFECITRQLNTALDTTLDQTDVYNENFIIQGDAPAIPVVGQNQYVVLPSRKRSRKNAISVRAKRVERIEEIIDEDMTKQLGQCNSDGRLVELEVTTLTDEKIIVQFKNTIRMFDPTFEIDSHQVTEGDKEGEIVVSTVTGKLNKYDMIIALTGNGTEETPFTVESNFGSLIRERDNHSEIGVYVDPKDKEMKFFIATCQTSSRTSEHKIIHKILPQLVVKGIKMEFAFLQYVGAPNLYKGFFLVGDSYAGAFRGDVYDCMQTGITDFPPIGFPIHDHWHGMKEQMVMYLPSYQTDEELLEGRVGHYIDPPSNLLEGDKQGEIDTAGKAYLPDQRNTDVGQLANIKIATSKPIYTIEKGMGLNSLRRIEMNGYINYYFKTDRLESNVNEDNNTWEFTPMDSTLDLNANVEDGFKLKEQRPINQQEMQHVTYVVMNPERVDKPPTFILLYICVPTENQKEMVITRIMKGPGTVGWVEGKGLFAYTSTGIAYDIFKYEGITHGGPDTQPKAILLEDEHGMCKFVNLAYTTPIMEDDQKTPHFVIGSILTNYNSYTMSSNKRKAGTNRALFGFLTSLILPLATSVLTAGIEWGAQKLFSWIGGKKAARAIMPHKDAGHSDIGKGRSFEASTVSNVSSKMSVSSYRGTVMLYHRYIPTIDPRHDDDALVTASKDNSLMKCWVDKDDQPLVPGEWLLKGAKQWFSCVTKPMNKADEDELNSAKAYVTLENPYERNDFIPGLNIHGEPIDTYGEKTITYHQHSDIFYQPVTIQDMSQLQDTDHHTIYLPEIESCKFIMSNDMEKPLQDIFHGDEHGDIIEVSLLEQGRRGEIIQMDDSQQITVQGKLEHLMRVGTDLRVTNHMQSSGIEAVNDFTGYPKTNTLKNAATTTPVYKLGSQTIPSSGHTLWTNIGMAEANAKFSLMKDKGNTAWVDGDWYQIRTDAQGNKLILFVSVGAKTGYDTSIIDPQGAGYDADEYGKYVKAKAIVRFNTPTWKDMVIVTPKDIPFDEWRNWRMDDARGVTTLGTCWDVAPYYPALSSKQITHRTTVQYKDINKKFQVVELMNPVLNFVLEQTYIEREDGKLAGHNPKHAAYPQKLDIGTTHKGTTFIIHDLTIGIMNGKTSDKTKMNFMTISFLEGESRVTTTQTVGGRTTGDWHIQIQHPNNAPHGTKVHTLYTLKGDGKGIKLPIDLLHDEQIRFFGYFDHQELDRSSQTKSEGKGWCELISDGTFTNISHATMPVVDNSE